MEKYDCIVLGAGIYGMYAAKKMSERGYRVALLEYDEAPFMRASFINQARVHNGYHYPRSFSTAKKSIDYFERFNRDFDFAVNNTFSKIYAIVSKYSYTTGEQFQKFCNVTGVPCVEINKKKFFREVTIDAAFETREYAFCGLKIRDYFLAKLKASARVTSYYGFKLEGVERGDNNYRLVGADGRRLEAPMVVNATYASINQVMEKFGFAKFGIKYEICEIIRCSTSKNIEKVGLTVMDGPFFSVMPFGFDCHSLTSVTFTPHSTCFETLPIFACQESNPACTPRQLGNCNTCPGRPLTAWKFMSQLARKFLLDTIDIHYKDSLFAIKPILVASELDDSRPTIVRKFSDQPLFFSVFSGKINTIYDLDEALLQ